MGKKRRPVLRVIAAMALTLCGCWNGKDQYRKFEEEGRARGVPLLIYDISANDPHRFLDQEPLGIAFLNTQDVPIASITLTLAVCNTMGQAAQPRDIRLVGPFEPRTSFILNPMGPPDSSGNETHVMLSHMVISAVEITDASGKHSFAGREVGVLLDERVANYCIARAM
ncbi:MAG: hypothetical protein ACM3ZT_05150 [Bacillota bacterium]